MKPNLRIKHHNITSALTKHIPESAIPYCLELWLQYPFHFKITRQRKTKQGDYSYNKINKTHIITVNTNLNRYSFLVTYIHEIAHLDAFQQYGYSISPHGKEWKKSFQRLMKPLLQSDIFPENILEALTHYMLNPKASTCSDPKLIIALQEHDLKKEGLTILSEVQINQTFCFNDKIFLKEKVKRTRAWCREVKSGKCYTVAESALVEVVQNEADSRRVISELTSSKK